MLTQSHAAAIEAIKTYKKGNLIKKSEKLGNLIEKKLNIMKKKFKCIGDVRGKGLFYAIEFIKNKNGERLIN